MKSLTPEEEIEKGKVAFRNYFGATVAVGLLVFICIGNEDRFPVLATVANVGTGVAILLLLLCGKRLWEAMKRSGRL
jgi:hypothetical protein